MPGTWTRGLAAATAGFLAGLLLARGSTLIARFDGLAFDAQARAVRALRGALAPGAGAREVVVVGIDEESLRRLNVPMAMLHEALGTALEVVAANHPRAIALDVSLPERSFDRFAPGLDRSLMRGLLAARNSAALVIALDLDGQGRPIAPYLPLLAVAGGEQAFGLPVFPVDCDGTVRRYEPDPAQLISARTCESWTRNSGAGADRSEDLPATLAGRIAARAGLGPALAQAGWIDFTRAPAFDYLPLHTLLESTSDPRSRLADRFKDRIVLFGSVLPYVDRSSVPVRIVGWEPSSTAPPGVVLNALVLQNAIDGRLLQAPPAFLRFAILLLVPAVVFVSNPSRRWRASLLGALALCGAGLLGHAMAWFLAPAQVLASLAVAVAVRSGLDLAAARADRDRLARSFGAYLSPQVRDLVMNPRSNPQSNPRSHVAPHAESSRRAIALLFADLRGFTAWSERSDPHLVRDTLNRYYEAITPVLHAHGGTIDNFRGDGVMVMFGAPLVCASPCKAALAAAQGLLRAIAELNLRGLDTRSAPRGGEPLQASIGLDFGDAVVGDVGSAERKDFTALGDAVNVAARLQDLAKQTNFAVCATARFVEQLPPGACDGLHPLGVREIKGHSPVEVYGWNP